MSSSKVNNKLFGHSKVGWRIEHFPLQTIKPEWIIQSPEFIVNGSEETSWCMYLRPELINKCRCVLFSLKRSNIDSGPEYILLELKTYSEYFKRKPIHCENNLFFKKGSKYEICLGTFEELNDNLHLIVCDMIVYNSGVNKRRSICNDAGLKLLSENMLELYLYGYNFDTKLIFGKNVIYAHKAILYARSEFLKYLLLDYENHEGFEEYTILNFTGFLNYNGMRKILAYLYTGDITRILEEPSFSIYECAVILEIEEIKSYYKPDKLILKSTIDLLEYTYILRGYNFDDKQLIYRFSNTESTTSLQLFFHPENHNEDRIPLFAETFDKIMNGFIECKFIDKNGQDVVPVKDEIAVEKNEEKEYKHNISSNIFEAVITFKLTANTQISYIDRYHSVFVNCINEDFYYKRLSADLKEIFENSNFTDTNVNINGFHFLVHKCILISRSQFFTEMLSLNGGRIAILVPDVERHILIMLFQYIYSGTLSFPRQDIDIIDVYKVAVGVNISQLKSMCSYWLRQCFKTNVGIRCRVIHLAREYNDDTLLNSVLIYFFEGKISSIIANPSIRLEDVHVCRHCQ